MFRDISQVVYLLPFSYSSLVNNYVRCEASSAYLLECWSTFASYTYIWESGGTAPLIHNVGTRLNEWSASLFTCCNPGENSPCTRLIGEPGEPQRRSGYYGEDSATDGGWTNARRPGENVMCGSASCLWALSTELASCHPTGAYNFEVRS
jgi:hypothetical protein